MMKRRLTHKLILSPILFVIQNRRSSSRITENDRGRFSIRLRVKDTRYERLLMHVVAVPATVTWVHSDPHTWEFFFAELRVPTYLERSGRQLLAISNYFHQKRMA